MVARLAFFMPTFSNLACFEVVGNKNLLLALKAEMPTSDFFFFFTANHFTIYQI